MTSTAVPLLPYLANTPIVVYLATWQVQQFLRPSAILES
nr:unnamed protein product [Callosobruchus analis]